MKGIPSRLLAAKCALLLLGAVSVLAAQTPAPQNPAGQPCVPHSAAAATPTSGAVQPPAPDAASPQSVLPAAPCTPKESRDPIDNRYARFLNGPEVKPFSPAERAHLAARNLIDPFNLLTITGEGAIAVAANSHTPEGPGLRGYGKYIGVSFTQDVVGEFFGTFLIPSIDRQDPHYHRMPKAGISRRIFHCFEQIAWTPADNGRGMVNYADLVGFAAEGEVNNLYVPGQHTNLRSTAARYGFTLASAPIDNFITEFLPSIASHIHTRDLFIQRIVNQVARSASNGQ
jgi:hypothetical protein